MREKCIKISFFFGEFTLPNSETERAMEEVRAVHLVEFNGRARMMQSYPARVLDRRLQEDWARAAKEGLGVLMNPRVDF